MKETNNKLKKEETKAARNVYTAFVDAIEAFRAKECGGLLHFGEGPTVRDYEEIVANVKYTMKISRFDLSTRIYNQLTWLLRAIERFDFDELLEAYYEDREDEEDRVDEEDEEDNDLKERWIVRSIENEAEKFYERLCYILRTYMTE